VIRVHALAWYLDDNADLAALGEVEGEVAESRSKQGAFA
jgi:hypothetical protein